MRRLQPLIHGFRSVWNFGILPAGTHIGHAGRHVPGAPRPNPRAGHLEAPRGRGDTCQEPAAVIAADEPGEPDGGAGGSGPVGAGAQAQDPRAGDVPADREPDGEGPAAGGGHGDGRRGAERGWGQWRADGGGAGGAGVWGDDACHDVGSDSGSD